MLGNLFGCLFFFLLIVLQAQALDNTKQQKGYCAVTRTTHICSWTEKKKKSQNRASRHEWKKWRQWRDEGGAVATRGVDREREEKQKGSKGIKSDGEKQRNRETALFTVD